MPTSSTLDAFCAPCWPQGGLVSAAALDFGVVLAFAAAREGRVTVTSASFPGTVTFHVDSVPAALRGATEEEPGCWGNFPRGAVMALKSKVRLLPAAACWWMARIVNGV